jgi:hypothetical protein
MKLGSAGFKAQQWENCRACCCRHHQQLSDQPPPHCPLLPPQCREVLASGALAGQIKDTKAARETQALADFMAMLAHDSSRAFYGPGHVLAAHEMGAIQVRSAVVCGSCMRRRGSAAERCGMVLCACPTSPFFCFCKSSESPFLPLCPWVPPLISRLRTLLTAASPVPLPISYPSIICLFSCRRC